jgi:hypothetical protein
VPPAPEVAEGHRRVRGVEVLREAEAEQQGQPDRHVGVAREIGVDLDRVRVHPDERLGAPVLAGEADIKGKNKINKRK